MGAILPYRLSSLQYNVDGLIVVSLHFEIGDPAITLGRCYFAVAQEVLYGDEIGISIQQLGCHRMSQMMTGYINPGPFCIGLDPLLDATD